MLAMDFKTFFFNSDIKIGNCESGLAHCFLFGILCSHLVLRMQ